MQRISSTVRGKWTLPQYKIMNWGGFRHFPLMDRIGINAPKHEQLEIIIAGLVHETNHWAQMYLLSQKERNRCLDAHDLWLGEYDDHMLERAAWWGTGFRKKRVRDAEW